MNRRRDHDHRVTSSSGNVFADLGLPTPDVALAKARLAAEIGGIIAQRRLTQSQAADVLGIPQPRVSLLVRGQLAGFSMERLLRFLNALGRDVEIVIGSAGGKNRGRLRIVTSKSQRDAPLLNA